jgi:DNA-binding CsgD family transcriptional regulator
MVLSRNSPSQAVADYREYYHARDVLMAEVGRRPSLIGTPGAAERILPRAEYERSEVWNDFLHPYGVRDIYYLLVGGHGAPVAMVNLMVPRIDADEAQLACYALAVLKPHLERAYAMHRQLQVAQLQSDLGFAALDRLAIGAVLLDAHGRVLILNETAETILKAKDGLAIERQTLTAAGPARDCLFEAVGRAFETSGALVVVPRPSGRRPFALSILPAGSAGGFFGLHAAAVFISDPERRNSSAAEAVRASYGLTPAESALCRKLSAGLSLQEIAERGAISITTVRSHLKSVFAKTGVQRQGELLQLLATPIVAPHPDNEESPTS